MSLLLPRRGLGRPNAAADARYKVEVTEFCASLLEIASRLDFDMSARGWGYFLEGHGEIHKGEIDIVEQLITACRKSGALPLNICAADENRAFQNLEEIDESSPEDFAEDWIAYVRTSAYRNYTPFSFWEHQDVYLQMVVEKIDLKALFAPVCAGFHIPIANSKGWGDIGIRADMMRRFAFWEAKGKQCVLLYCGDFDPGGLRISDALRANMAELDHAVGWSPSDLVIDRFGLNADYIVANNLIWIDNLITGAGKDLASPKHPHHRLDYVQEYLSSYGARKVEANALLGDPEAGRDLCRDAILKYIASSAPASYAAALGAVRREARDAIERLLGGAS